MDETLWKDFFDHSPIGFHVFGPDRRIIAINQAELSMIGYSREEIVGKKTWSDLIVPEQGKLFEQHWEKLMAVGQAVDLEYTVVHKEGRRIQVVLNASARKDRSGRIVNTRGTVLDITRRKQLEAEAMNSKNIALGEVLSRIEVEKQQIRKNVMDNVEQLVLPLLIKLKRKGSSLDRRHIELLESTLKDIASSFGGAIAGRGSRLSPREIEICNMIRKGLSTKDISGLLNASCRTIDNHRNRIRKKLGVSQHKVNLASYLQTLDT